MDPKANSLNWFEIPANDICRSKKFYETIFSMSMYEMEMPGIKMAMFPAEPKSGKANGGIAKSDMHKTGVDGVIVYLNANPDLSTVLSKIDAAGGKVLTQKTSIGPNGFMAFFMDTEGNKIGLHSVG